MSESLITALRDAARRVGYTRIFCNAVVAGCAAVIGVVMIQELARVFAVWVG